MRLKRMTFSVSIITRYAHVLLSHLTAMLAVIVIICFIIDRFNTAMEFMTSSLSKWCILILAVLALASSILTIIALWVNPDRQRRRRKQ